VYFWELQFYCKGLGDWHLAPFSTFMHRKVSLDVQIGDLCASLTLFSLNT